MHFLYSSYIIQTKVRNKQVNLDLLKQKKRKNTKCLKLKSLIINHSGLTPGESTFHTLSTGISTHSHTHYLTFLPFPSHTQSQGYPNASDKKTSPRWVENTENPWSQAIILCLSRQVSTPLMLSVKKDPVLSCALHLTWNQNKTFTFKGAEKKRAIHYGGVANVLYYSSLKLNKMK